MDTIHEERITAYRTGLLARLSSPCSGRFDKAWDIEADFSQARQDYHKLLSDLLVSEKDDFSQQTLLALLEELDWAVKAVESAWDAQTKIMSLSRQKQRENASDSLKRDKAQRSLESFS